jgi:hypothetical protein
MSTSALHGRILLDALLARRSMSNWLRTLVGLVVAVVMALSATVSFAQERYGLSDEAYGIFDRWLRSSCIGDEERALSEGLLRYRAVSAPAFEKAIAERSAGGRAARHTDSRGGPFRRTLEVHA